MATPRSSLLRLGATVGAGLALGVALSGCFTGQRPSFDENDPSRGMTGAPAIDAVLERLDATPSDTFSAEYATTTKLGSLPGSATVVQDGDRRRSITVNDVRFLITGDTSATCDLATSSCEAVIDDARISDLMLTHEFYADAFARRLRVDADRRVADPTGYVITQAGREALCTDVAVTGGTKSYCAFEGGPLARYDGPDLLIEATSLTDGIDEAAFEPSRPGD
jgi:hypothetical protein